MSAYLLLDSGKRKELALATVKVAMAELQARERERVPRCISARATREGRKKGS